LNGFFNTKQGLQGIVFIMYASEFYTAYIATIP